MPLNIKHPDADRLARELAKRRKQSITEVVIGALEDALAKERRALRAPGVARELLGIGDRFSSLPSLDQRSDDDIIGYNQHGLDGYRHIRGYGDFAARTRKRSLRRIGGNCFNPADFSGFSTRGRHDRGSQER